MASELAAKECVPCKGGVSPLKGSDLDALVAKLGGGWKVISEHHLEKVYKFDNWEDSVAFMNDVADIAHEQDHHPDVLLTFGKVTVTIWTHKIDGLTESDFVFAAKVDEAHEE